MFTFGLTTTPLPTRAPKNFRKKTLIKLKGNMLDLKKIILTKYHKNLRKILPGL
jgi:hypothetical protein